MASFSLLESRPQTVSTDVVVEVHAIASTTRHLVILDPAVDKADWLSQGIKAGYGLELLSSEQPGLEQISEILRRYPQLDTLHIVSHGRAGALQLGDGWVTVQEMASAADAVMGWAESLAPDASVLFYGCELAKGEVGKRAIALLQELLNATVYAASTPVGTPAMGGQWLLETANQQKTTAFAFEPATLDAYPAVFTAPVHHLNGEAIEFIQLGNDINGLNPGDEEGYSVSLSADGQTIIVSSIESYSRRGHARIFTLVNDTWQQIGGDIIGQAGGDFNGSSVDISDDGNIVAIGAYGSNGNGSNSGQVRIFQNVNGDWQQIGNNINGAQPSNESGGRSSGVSLSADGNIVAIGGYNYRHNGQTIGHVRVFENVNGDWIQRGPDIIGEAQGDVFGWAVELSDDGNRLVTSGIYNDGSFFRAGHGRVFDFNYGANEWQQVGSDIDGEAYDDHIGVGVAISADGSTVSLGAPRNDENGNDSGHARVYRLVNGDWQQIGEDIDGEAPEDHFGHGVKLSENGDIVAIATEFDNGDQSNAAEVYKNYSGTWAQLGGIQVKDTTGHDGRIVGLSEDGKIVAVTSLLHDGPNGPDTGNVRIFSVPENILEGNSGYSISLGGLSITDADFDFTKVSLSVAHGILFFDSLANVGVIEGAEFSPSITIVGHISDINLALSGLSYESEAHFVGTDALVITSSDDLPDAKTTTNAIALDVTPAPQETAVNFSDGLLTFENSDSNTFNSNIFIDEFNGELNISDSEKFFNIDPDSQIGTGAFVHVDINELTKPISFSLGNGRNEIEASSIGQGISAFGGKGEDEFRTGSGRDRLFGKTDNDIIEAGAGNDLVNGGAGADVLNGGDGIDVLDYSGSREGVQVYLDGNTVFGGHANGDMISGFEKVFGSNHDDFLGGDEQNNMLWGRDGDDDLSGRGGRDLLRGGQGNNLIDGGEGIDTVDYRDAKTGVFADLDLGQGNAGPLTIDALFNIENAFGSAFNDELHGTEGNNFLSGFQGADMLYGHGGNDTLRGGQGGDQLDGGLGKDTADYRGSSAGVEVSLDTGLASGGDAEGDSLLSIERLTGSQFIDTLEGDNGNNILKGEGKGDTLRGLGGADTLRGGTGADLLLGGGGRDTFDFRVLAESLMDSYDVIGDLNANLDKIKGTQANAGRQVTSLGNTTGFTESEIADVLNTTDFVAGGVATFKFATQGGSTLTFLALNDLNSGFQANSDAIIDITGHTGSINNLTIV